MDEIKCLCVMSFPPFFTEGKEYTFRRSPDIGWYAFGWYACWADDGLLYSCVRSGIDKYFKIIEP